MYGLGTLYKVASDGSLIDCDSWSNLFQGPCWDPTAPEVVPNAPGDSSNTPGQPYTPPSTTTANTLTNCILAGTCGTSSISTPLLIGGLALLGLALVMMMGGRR